jgi:uncharacterized protein YhfF
MTEAAYSDDVRRFWLTFCAENDVEPDQRFDAFAFGDSTEMADELSALVLHGPKRATAGLLADYADEPLPEVGAHSIVLGGTGQPVCVIRTTEVRVLPFREVDAAFAWDEGEGDRSLAYWRDAHIGFFTRMCANRGDVFGEEMATVLERFAMVWPAASAGPGGRP